MCPNCTCMSVLSLVISNNFMLIAFIRRHYTHTRLTALIPGLPGWAGSRKVKPIWILLKQETVSCSGISWATCKSASRFRQITMPAPHHSIFTGRMPFLPPNQQHQSTEGKSKALLCSIICVTCCRHIITCGSDGDVRIYKGFGDNDPVSYRIGDAVYCVCFKVFNVLFCMSSCWLACYDICGYYSCSSKLTVNGVELLRILVHWLVGIREPKHYFTWINLHRR